MSVTEQIDTLLQDPFGFDEPRPGQRAVMEHLLECRSAAAVFPTGGGKSLCYQLPALALEGVTLVISPLIALMKDQIDQLRAKGVAAARLDSSLTADEYREVMQQVRQDELKLLYVAPERLNNERFRETIATCRVAMMAIDEAHCISEWGHNFRPDYLKLAEFARQSGCERVLALTATATPQVLEDICREFEIEDPCAVRTPFHRQNLSLRVTPVTGSSRDDVLRQRLENRPLGPTIVYVTLQKTAELVAQALARAGFEARAYHAGMDNRQRAEVQDWFMSSAQGVVVATIAFGMGVDKADIRYVYHYNLPKSIENYSQEIGRAGRDDAPSICETLACLDDLRTLENFVYGDTPAESAVAELIQELLNDSSDELSVSFHELSSRHDIRPIVARTLLTYLELEGILEGGTPFYSDYQFKPRMSSAEILDRFSGDRREFLAGIFRKARKAKTWFHVDVDAVAAALKSTRERVVVALDYLGEQDLLELRAAGVRHRYRVVRQPEDPQAVVDEMNARMRRREQMEIARLGEVVALLGGSQCLAEALCNHFGETLEAPCGVCSVCQSGAAELAQAAPDAAAADLGELPWAELEELRQRHPAALATPRALARFLCGISSPRASRAKLARHDLFGSFAEQPFAAVLRKTQDHEVAEPQSDGA